MRTNLSFYVSPHFISKYYLLRDITQLTKTYSFTGAVLDLGCGEKPYQELFKATSVYMGIDFKSYSRNPTFARRKPDKYFAATYLKTFKLPFRSNKFDTVVSFQTMEHHKKPKKMVAELSRVVKTGGYVLISFPFIWGLHEEPNDYYRYTHFAINELLSENGCEIITVKKQGSICSTIVTLATDSLIEFSQKNMFLRILAYIIFPFFLASSYLCILLDKLLKTERIFLNYIILAKKTSPRKNGKIY